MSNAPHLTSTSAFWADPYPALARMRKEAPIAFVPQLGSTIFTRRDDIFTQEKRIDVFSSHQPAGLMNMLMGHNMMRKDGEAHMAERAAMFPAVSPRTVRDTWSRQFQAHADRILDELAPRGARRSLQGVRAAAVGRMPEGHHRAHQHALSGHGRVVAGDDRRHRQLHAATRRSRRAAMPPPPGSMPRSTT